MSELTRNVSDSTNPADLDRGRRSFCVHACQAASLLAVAPFIHGCGNGPTSPSDSTPLAVVSGSAAAGILTVPVPTSSPLAAAGGLALVRVSAGDFLIARTAADAAVTFTAVCTHDGCAITGSRDGIFVCPCHGSTFNTSGAVVAGPATRALRQFTTRIENGTILITL